MIIPESVVVLTALVTLLEFVGGTVESKLRVCLFVLASGIHDVSLVSVSLAFVPFPNSVNQL